MAVRRTREEKIKAQQRRTEMFSWRPAVLESDAPKVKTNGVRKNKPVTDISSQYLQQDLLKTLIATLFVVFLLGVAYLYR